MDRESKAVLNGGIASLIAVLLGINAFFAKRFLDQQDETNRLVSSLQQQVLVLTYRIDTINETTRRDKNGR